MTTIPFPGVAVGKRLPADPDEDWVDLPDDCRDPVLRESDYVVSYKTKMRSAGPTEWIARKPGEAALLESDYRRVQIALAVAQAQQRPHLSGKRPLLGSAVAGVVRRLIILLEEDPDWLLRKATYVSMFLAILAGFLATIHEGAAAVFVTSGILVAWGLASALTYSVLGRSSVNIQFGALLLLAGLGTTAVAVVAILS